MFKFMVQDAFAEISDITSKVSSLINWTFPLLWNHVTSGLEHALRLEALGEFSPEQVQNFYDIPSKDEWKKVEVVSKLVKSTYGIAKVLFETNYPHANTYLIYLQELRAILAQESISSRSFTSKVTNKMLSRLDKYWENGFLVLAITSVMDPRYKMKYIEYFTSKCEGSDGHSRAKLVLDAIRSLYKKYMNHGLERENSMSDTASSYSVQEFPSRVEQGFFSSSFLKDYNQLIQTNDLPPKSELDCYFDEPVLPWRPDFNAVARWRAESPKYPTV